VVHLLEATALIVGAGQLRSPKNAEERHGRGSTLITSQIPADRWHDVTGDSTLS
jgi:hypothetical protein